MHKIQDMFSENTHQVNKKTMFFTLSHVSLTELEEDLFLLIQLCGEDTFWDDQRLLGWLMRWIEKGQRGGLNVFVRQACSLFFRSLAPRGGLTDCLIESSAHSASPFAAQPLPVWEERGGELWLWCFCSPPPHGQRQGASLLLVARCWTERLIITAALWQFLSLQMLSLHSSAEADDWSVRLRNSINSPWKIERFNGPFNLYLLEHRVTPPQNNSCLGGQVAETSRTNKREEDEDRVSTHSLVPRISSVAVSLLPQTRPDADSMSSVLIAAQHHRFREADWSCASRKSLLMRWPPDARLMKDLFVSQHSNGKMQSSDSGWSPSPRRMQPHPAGRARFDKCHLIFLLFIP